jgi:hypothetical protein
LLVDSQPYENFAAQRSPTFPNSSPRRGTDISLKKLKKAAYADLLLYVPDWESSQLY